MGNTPWGRKELDTTERLTHTHMVLKGASSVAQMVKRLPTMQETQVRSLGQEDPLEKEMAPHSSNSCLENPMGGGAW